MKSFLVTGSNGLIGSKITKYLLSKNYHVQGFALGQKNIDHPKYIFTEGDITNLESVTNLFTNSQFDCVIHAAALVHNQSKNLSKDDYFNINFFASKNIFDLCAKYKVKQVVFLSTVEVYGDQNTNIFSEDLTPNPQTYYAESKFLAENWGMKIACKNQINFTVLRLAPVYNNGMTFNIDKRISVLNKKVFVKISKKNCDLSLCSLRNLIDIIELVIGNKKAFNQIFNVVDKEPYQIEYIINLFKKLSNNKLPTISISYYLLLLIIRILENCLNLVNYKNSIYTIKNLEKFLSNKIYLCEKAQKFLGYRSRWNLKNSMVENK